MTHSNDPLYGRHFFAAAFLPCFSKLIDLNFAFGKDYGDYQLSSHGSDKVLQRADVHAGAALDFSAPQLRYGSLIHAENFCGTSEVLTSLLNHAILIVSSKTAL